MLAFSLGWLDGAQSISDLKTKPAATSHCSLAFKCSILVKTRLNSVRRGVAHSWWNPCHLEALLVYTGQVILHWFKLLVIGLELWDTFILNSWHKCSLVVALSFLGPITVLLSCFSSAQRPQTAEQPKPFKVGISKPRKKPERMKCGCPVYPLIIRETLPRLHYPQHCS